MPADVSQILLGTSDPSGPSMSQCVPEDPLSPTCAFYTALVKADPMRLNRAGEGKAAAWWEDGTSGRGLKNRQGFGGSGVRSTGTRGVAVWTLSGC